MDFFLKLFLQGDVPNGTRERLIDYLAKVRQQTVPVYWTDDQAADHPPAGGVPPGADAAGVSVGLNGSPLPAMWERG